MRLCLLIYGSLDTLTGGFLYDQYLVRHLRHKGHTVDIVSLPWRRYGRLLLDNFSLRLKSTLGANRYDLILQDALIHPSLFWLNHRQRRVNGVPIVSIVHQVLSSQPRKKGLNRLYRVIEKRYLNSVDAFVFNSQTTRGHVHQLINRQLPSIVANPGADRLGHLQIPELPARRARRSGPLELVFVGNITPIKGLIPLLESLIRLPPDTWRLTVVGSLKMDRRHVGRIRRMLSTHRIAGRVRLMGSLQSQDLINIFVNSQLFVMPFANEGFGIACLEALSYGLPVLASATGAVKELIQDGINGFLIPAGETQTCADVIFGLHNDRDQLSRLSEAARQTALARPGWNDTVDAIHYFLTHLPKQRQTHTPHMVSI
ncbi:MAG: glycosyltransferase family 4 protein [Desulfobacterales bacterium]|jgi:glycosyltransferase involved in cell wall biosynthesis